MHERGTPCLCHGILTLRDVACYPYYTINAYILLVWGVWGPIKESKYRILHKDPWMPHISAAFTVISQESVAQSQRAGYIHTARGGDCKQTHRQYRETEYKSCMLYRSACLELKTMMIISEMNYQIVTRVGCRNKQLQLKLVYRFELEYMVYIWL